MEYTLNKQTTDSSADRFRTLMLTLGSSIPFAVAKFASVYIAYTVYLCSKIFLR